MSYYKSMMTGSNKKKKVIKEQSKPKKTVLDGIKQELNEWTHKPSTEKRWSKSFGGSGLTEHEQQLKEVGAAREYRPHIKKIDKLYHDYWDAVKDFTDLLLKKGVKKEANNIHRMYMKLVHKFHKSYFVKMINKLM